MNQVVCSLRCFACRYLQKKLKATFSCRSLNLKSRTLWLLDYIHQMEAALPMAIPHTAAGKSNRASAARLLALKATGSAIFPPPPSKPESNIRRPSREAAEKVPTVATCRPQKHRAQSRSLSLPLQTRMMLKNIHQVMTDWLQNGWLKRRAFFVPCHEGHLLGHRAAILQRPSTPYTLLQTLEPGGVEPERRPRTGRRAPRLAAAAGP